MIKTRILNAIAITIALGALFGVLFLLSAPIPSDWQNGGTLYIGQDKSINLRFADTPELRQQGLSASSVLPLDQGLMFVFDTPAKPGFWMKDMHYPIDIIWINTKKRVVAIHAHVLPESYPQVLYPPTDVAYVLEINAGQAQKLGLVIGSKINFSVN